MNDNAQVMEFKTRPAQTSDLEILVSFTKAEALDAEGTGTNEEAVKRGVAVALRDPTIATYWVVESNQKEVVGSASAVREWSDWHGKNYWWIQSLYVVSRFRGQGLAGLLIKTIENEARKSKAVELRLYVHNDNELAIRAYRRHGFRNSSYTIMTKRFQGEHDDEPPQIP